MKHVTDALRHFLAKHDIQKEVKLVLVVKDEIAVGRINSSIIRDFEPELITADRSYAYGGREFRINGVHVLVRAVKEGVTL